MSEDEKAAIEEKEYKAKMRALEAAQAAFEALSE